MTERAVRDAPPWLVSSLAHMLLIVLLGLIMLHDDRVQPIRLDVALSEQLGEQLEAEPLSVTVDQSSAVEELVTPLELPQVDDPFAAPPELELATEMLDSTSLLDVPRIGLALRGREEGMKEALLAAYGGNAQSESAVQLALQWLAKQQRPDGSWSLVGPYRDAGGFENTAAATAMAMLAFQGAGHSHQAGAFQKHVQRGKNYLVGLLDSDGNFFRSGPQNAAFYTQGQCLIAICELYGLTRDPELREPAQRAIDYCVRVQDRSLGGWRYYPGTDSDTSVTGWILMGLQSGLMAGLDVPSDVFMQVGQYLDRAASENGTRYSYVPGSRHDPVMTAEGLLCRQYLGWTQSDARLRDGVEYLLLRENHPSWDERNVYYWYYATQVMHHMEGAYWKEWNGVMRDLLVKHQVTKGPEGGSWHPTNPQPDRYGFHAGRLYVTCLSVYILEVYYRHLPLYSQKALLAQ